MSDFKHLKHKIYQNDNYLEIEDNSLWPLENGMLLSDIVTVAVFFTDETPTVYNMETSDSIDKSLYIDKNIFYTINVFAVKRFNGVVILHEYVWYDENVWLTVNNSSLAVPSDSNPDYIKVESSAQISTFMIDVDTNAKISYYTRIETYENNDFLLTKTDNHHFLVTYNGDSNIIAGAVLFDYKDNVLQELDYEDRLIDLIFDEDGLYKVKIILDDNSESYLEIYDFTDIEKCYKYLIDKMICGCDECDGCVDDGLNNIINFVITYMTLRDMIYSERAVNIGLESVESRKEDYILTIGRLIEKLKIIINSCSCNFK